MPDYDKLEQLNRLRESGALTADEFEREKITLLDRRANLALFPKQRRNMLIGTAIIVASAIIVLSSGVFKHLGQPIVGSSTTLTTFAREVSPLNSSKASIQKVAEVAAGPTLDWAFSPEVIGLNPVFVEGKLGPAKTKSKSSWTFDIQGCEVTYAVGGNEITSAGSPVNEKCHPNVDSRTLTPQTTFTDVGMTGNSIRASCISMCGNAYDPTIDLYQSGYHANGYIEIIYNSANGEPQDTATELWQKAVRASHGIEPNSSDSDGMEWFNCVKSPPKAVETALGPEHIGYVTIGRDLGNDGNCQYESK